MFVALFRGELYGENGRTRMRFLSEARKHNNIFAPSHQLKVMGRTASRIMRCPAAEHMYKQA
jgi:hypothetical protein